MFALSGGPQQETLDGVDGHLVPNQHITSVFCFT